MQSKYYVVVADNFGFNHTYCASVERPRSERGAVRIRRNALKAGSAAGLRGGLHWVQEFAIHTPH